ncbi:MAG: universal stress protein [Deferrisomatales bacterium]
MFRRALVATDLSPASERLLECSAQLQELGCRHLTLAHVEETRFSVGLDESLAEAHRPDLARQAETLEAQGYEVEALPLRGVPWYEIVAAARRTGADLLVVASHGHGALAESLLGGTAARVVEHAPCPVLVLRMSLMEQDGGRYCPLRFADVLGHVLFPTDFSAGSRRAFEVLQGLAGRITQVTLLHVNQELAWEHLAPEIARNYEEDDARRLADTTAVLRNAGCERVSPIVARGDPRRILLEWAGKEDVSLVVLGSRGWGPVKELLLGSTAHALVRHARAPVLVVRP